MKENNQKLYCEITGNLCGTDTVGNDGPCECPYCTIWWNNQPED